MHVLIGQNPPKKKKGRGGNKKTKSNNGAEYHVFTRWGRTGTGGQAKMEGPFEDEDEAKAAFEKTFKSKTAVDWDQAVAGEEPHDGKYEYLAVSENTGKEDAKWYYYLQNDPLGKPNGWYEYDGRNSQEVEDLYGDYLASKKAKRLATRVVTSESSGFQYCVDLSMMLQRNTSSGTTRPIRRTETGKPPSDRRGDSEDAGKLFGSDSDDSSEEEFEDSDDNIAVTNYTESKTKRNSGVVDKMASSLLKSGSIYEDYAVMLNQTNLGANNNKFYKMQLIETSTGSYHLFTRWGRVGEDGQTQEQGPIGDIDTAIKEFAKKFKAKSANSWDSYREDKDSFISKKGKYTVVEMEQDDAAVSAMATALYLNKPAAKSELEPDTKELIDLIFNEDMFKSAMTDMNLDPKKLPLGALSQAQITKGFTVLEQLENAINSNSSKAVLEDITSNFYTLIPHAFGRRAGPVLDTADKVQEKYEMLNTLTDIEAAQSMQKTKKETDSGNEETRPNPSDLKYQQLAADLTLLNAKKDKDFKLIKSYFDDTKDIKGYGGAVKLQQVWRVDRHNEEKRFARHADIEERKLLWHGTNVAVVAAILKSGLRIMPHSGGRVGRGIYLADQHQKSMWYTRSAQGTTLMFLVEAALGESHEIMQDDCSLRAAPEGFNSVLAKGEKAPPREKELKIDGKSVAVPQGKPRAVSGASKSSFDHNEFLIYQESQHRIRYILSFAH